MGSPVSRDLAGLFLEFPEHHSLQSILPISDILIMP